MNSLNNKRSYLIVVFLCSLMSIIGVFTYGIVVILFSLVPRIIVDVLGVYERSTSEVLYMMTLLGVSIIYYGSLFWVFGSVFKKPRLVMPVSIVVHFSVSVITAFLVMRSAW